jgi:hypothetical protein
MPKHHTPSRKAKSAVVKKKTKVTAKRKKK